MGEGKVSFNDIVIKATALALRQHPACNAWWQDDRIRYWADVHVAMAVAVEDGLITPIIRHADRKSLREIACRGEGPGAARAGAEAQAGGVHRRHLLGLQPRHVRHRRVHRDHQPARGRHPCRGRIADQAVVARGPACDPEAAAAHHVVRSPGHRWCDGCAVPAHSGAACWRTRWRSFGEGLDGSTRPKTPRTIDRGSIRRDHPWRRPGGLRRRHSRRAAGARHRRGGAWRSSAACA